MHLERAPIATIDLDGVIFREPLLGTRFPEETLKEILARLPFLERLIPQLYPVSKEALGGLDSLDKGEFIIIGLSGRPIRLQPITEGQLRDNHLLPYFRSLLLNPTAENSGHFKNLVIKLLLNGGHHLVHVENNRTIATQIAENNQSAQVILVDNSSRNRTSAGRPRTHSLPNNILPIRNIGEIGEAIAVLNLQ